VLLYSRAQCYYILELGVIILYSSVLLYSRAQCYYIVKLIAGDTVLVTDTSKTAVMKKYKKDFAGGQMASTGSTPGTGVALPPGDQFLGAGNDSLPSAQSVVSCLPL